MPNCNGRAIYGHYSFSVYRISRLIYKIRNRCRCNPW